MPQTNKKSINHWTENHDEFCLEHKLTPCAKLLWQWLIRQKDDEPDLKEFNNWVRKHRGKPYCRPSIKTAFNQLVECRVVKLVKQFTWHLVRIITRTIEDLFPKKNCRNQNKNYATQPSTPQSVETGEYNSIKSSIDDFTRQEILLECAEHGIIFNPKQNTDLFKYHREDITAALNYYSSLSQRSRSQIYNPPGWFLSCLEYQYWQEISLIDFLVMLEGIAPIGR